MFIKYLGQPKTPDIIMFIVVIFIRDKTRENEISSGFNPSFKFLKDNKYLVGQKNQKIFILRVQSNLAVTSDLGP